MSKESLQQALEPMMSMINGLDLTSAYTAQEKLNDSFPVTELQEIKDLCIQGLNAGWLCPRTAPNLQYGRLIKSQKNGDVGIDTVYMPGTKKKCEGPGHEHPQGEVDLCFTTAGNALFDGNQEGWTVYPPKSWHVPTVSEGDMIILYFLPNGSIRFGAKES